MLEDGLELVASASGKTTKFDKNNYSSLPLVPGTEEISRKTSSIIHCNTINVTTGTNTGYSPIHSLAVTRSFFSFIHSLRC